MPQDFCLQCESSQYRFSYVHYAGKGTPSVTHIDKDLFSVFMLLDGEALYDIEGKRIRLTANDILLVSNNELHRSLANQKKRCEYLLLMVNLDFFIRNNCTHFSEMVFNRTPGNDNLIPAKTVLDYGIADIFLRLDGYCREKPVEKAVVNGVIVELMYRLDQHAVKSRSATYSQGKIGAILDYINENITERLSLDDIAKHFYLTKQYLCKTFKKNTGYTVNRYIAYKRIALVKEAYFSGMTLSEACYKAGFNDYSSFYRAYSKITDESPRKGLSQKAYPR